MKAPPRPSTFPPLTRTILGRAVEGARSISIELSSPFIARDVAQSLDAYRESLLWYYRFDPKTALLSLTLSIKHAGRCLVLQPNPAGLITLPGHTVPPTSEPKPNALNPTSSLSPVL